MSLIGDLASNFRTFLEPIWEDWKLKTGRPIGGDLVVSENMCGFTSAFTSIALAEQDGRVWRVAGGWPKSGGGVTCPNQKLNSHFWTVSDDGIVVDLTADQFGMSNIIVTKQHDPRYIESFTDERVSRYMPYLMPLAEEWIETARQCGVLPYREYRMNC